MNPAMKTIRYAFVLLLALGLTSLTHAQVRQEPAGNTLPAAVTPETHASDMLLDPQAVKLSRDKHRQFASQVNVDAFRRLSVFEGGRTKVIDTLAREYLDRVYGKSRFKDTWDENGKERSIAYDPVFTYLDLIFNQQYYLDKSIIYVEQLNLRRAVLAHLSEADQETWLRRGRLTPLMLADRSASEALMGMNQDMIAQKGIAQVRFALMNFQHPQDALFLVSPKAGSEVWTSVFELYDTRPIDAAGVPVLPATTNADIAVRVCDEFKQLASAWHHTDAAAVNASLARLSDLIPQINPESYPPKWKRSAEYYYNATRKFTFGYVGYFLGTVVLLIAFATQRRALIRAGVAFFLIGFAIHSLGMLTRGVLAGRWPIHNQYESFIALTWIAVAVGMILMFAKRQWLFGAAAAAVGTAALVFANTVDIPSREVNQVAGILATSRILYVHVNMVIASYGLIGLGFFLSVFYLGVHYTQGAAAARFAAAGLGEVHADDAQPVGRLRVLNDLDRAQMVVLQLAFWLLGVGILLGAYWADHAWGRWWAWDPKETWALITWIIYLMVIHLRLAVKNRGLVTAWMSVVGFFVMLWTHWGVNLLLAGLHSYA